MLTSVSDLVTPLNYINANIAALVKSSANTYNTIIINNTFEVCGIMENAPPIVKFFLPLISKFAPQLIHPCPYEGRRIGVENIAIDMQLLPLIQLSNMPKGDYRVDVSFYDKWWNIVHWIKLFGAVQQKRFKKRHLGPTTAATEPTQVDAKPPE